MGNSISRTRLERGSQSPSRHSPNEPRQWNHLRRVRRRSSAPLPAEHRLKRPCASVDNAQPQAAPSQSSAGPPLVGPSQIAGDQPVDRAPNSRPSTPRRATARTEDQPPRDGGEPRAGNRYSPTALQDAEERNERQAVLDMHPRRPGTPPPHLLENWSDSDAEFFDVPESPRPHPQRHLPQSPRNRDDQLDQAEERRLISQLSRTLFTAVLLIASHAINGAVDDAPPPPAHDPPPPPSPLWRFWDGPEEDMPAQEDNPRTGGLNGQLNGQSNAGQSNAGRSNAGRLYADQQNADRSGARPVHRRTDASGRIEGSFGDGDEFREEVTRRIWNALYTGNGAPQRDRVDTSPFDSMYSQRNLQRLAEIQTLGGEPFLGFMDELWDGRLNSELMHALVGNEAFFRIFQFPRDREGRLPVLVLRVTSVVDQFAAEPRDLSEDEEDVSDEEDDDLSDNEDGDDDDGDGDDEDVADFLSPRRTEMVARSHTPDRRVNFDDMSSDDDEDDDALLARQSRLETLADRQRRREERHQRQRAEARRRDSVDSGRDGLDARADAQPRAARANRSWITYVVRGTFTDDHPIFAAESLRTNRPSVADLELLDHLFMPPKHNAASQEDLDSAGGVYTVDPGSSMLDERCPVCLENYDVGDECRSLNCTHTFHKECLDSWLLKNNSCPMCRRDGVQLH